MFNQKFYNNSAMIGLVILSVGYMLMSKMELNNQSLSSLLLFGGALMCVFNNKRKSVKSEACFLISIYLLSTLLAKFKDLRERFNEDTTDPPPSAGEVIGWILLVVGILAFLAIVVAKSASEPE